MAAPRARYTPLLAAIHCGSETAATPMASFLIDYGSDVNATDELGTSVLHVVVVLGYSNLAMLLARNGARVNSLCVPPPEALLEEAVQGERMSALHLACSLASVSVSTVSSLLKVRTTCVCGGGEQVELLLRYCCCFARCVPCGLVCCCC